MRLALSERNHQEYEAAYRRIERLEEVRRLLARRDELGARLGVAAGQLRAASRIM